MDRIVLAFGHMTLIEQNNPGYWNEYDATELSIFARAPHTDRCCRRCCCCCCCCCWCCCCCCCCCWCTTTTTNVVSKKVFLAPRKKMFWKKCCSLVHSDVVPGHQWITFKKRKSRPIFCRNGRLVAKFVHDLGHCNTFISHLIGKWVGLDLNWMLDVDWSWGLDWLDVDAGWGRDGAFKCGSRAGLGGWVVVKVSFKLAFELQLERGWFDRVLVGWGWVFSDW